MRPIDDVLSAQNRRAFLEHTGLGLGKLALASLLTGALDPPRSVRAAAARPPTRWPPTPAIFPRRRRP